MSPFEKITFSAFASHELSSDEETFFYFFFRKHTSAPRSIPMDATDVYLDGNDLGNFTSQERETNHLLFTILKSFFNIHN